MAEENIPKQRIEEIIKEEFFSLLEENKIDDPSLREGIINRIMAQTKGELSALKTIPQRGIQALKLAATGKADLSKVQDPKLVKIVNVATTRIAAYEKQFLKLVKDFSNDIELLFGEGVKNAPEISQEIAKLDQSATSFSKQLAVVSKKINAKLQGNSVPNSSSPGSKVSYPQKGARRPLPNSK